MKKMSSNNNNNKNNNSNDNNKRDTHDNHVCVVPNSESDLDELFNSALNPDSKRPLQVPWHMRNLPDSFFTPPSTGSKSPSVQSISHTRENSADSAFGTNTTSTLQVNHPRAHSSPASLQQTLASAQQQPPPANQPQTVHIKQRSYDMGARDVMDDLNPLPPGWEQARTPQGQIYYLNHITRTTTWEDPRKTLTIQNLQAQQAELKNRVPQSPGSKTTSITTATLGPLPDGWEQSQTADGEIYFINHVTKTTSWFDPRIPQHLQRSPGLLHGVGNTFIQPLGQSLQLSQQKLRLHSLQLERERLRQRQAEIMRQELMLRPTDIPPGTMDPFLSSLNDHGRQESVDSGLGLSNNYSLPQTPQDLLDESMDGVSEGGGTNDMLDNTDINTDDLVPSLTLGEELSTDILNDVQSLINPATTRPDNVLTWL